MTFDWLDYLKLARALRQLAEPDEAFSPISEAAHRAAISRAYYAVFSLACNFIIEKRSSEIRLSKGPTVHSEVIHYFKSSSRKDEKQIGTAR